MKWGNNTIFICVFICIAGISFVVTCFRSVNYSNARQIKATSNFVKYVTVKARTGKRTLNIQLLHKFCSIFTTQLIYYYELMSLSSNSLENLVSLLMKIYVSYITDFKKINQEFLFNQRHDPRCLSAAQMNKKLGNHQEAHRPSNEIIKIE